MGTIFSFFTTGKYWLIALGITAAVAFGTGYYKGSDHVLTKTVNASASQIANAQAQGEAAGRTAQKSYDDQQYAFAVADARKRGAQDALRNARLMQAKADNQNKVTDDPNCVIKADQMKAINSVVTTATTTVKKNAQ